MIVHQPYDKQLGVALIEELESSKYNQLTIMVAYAKLSGVYRLLPYLRNFKNNNGRLRCIVGIDQQNTTYEAIEQLEAVADELFIFHSESISQTFHVKCYWLSGQVDTWYAIGSNNLTAGGLFSNYEMSVMSHNTGKEASDANIRLEAIYKSYASSTSYCSRSVDKHFLQELLTSDYIVKEIQLRRAIATLAKKKRSFSATKQQHLFGNEIFSAPTLPTEFKKKQQKWVSTKKVQPQNVMLPQAVAPDDIQVNDNLYLIRLVPSAGDRSKQVHFTKELLSSYFCLTPGDNILVQEMLPSGGVGKIEQRQIVLSQRNQNVKIELAGAAILNDNYPSNPETKPVLIIKRINSNLFVYMLLLDGSDGYAAINNHLKSLPPRRWFPFEVIDEDAMFSLWSDCPLM